VSNEHKNVNGPLMGHVKCIEFNTKFLTMWFVNSFS